MQGIIIGGGKVGAFILKTLTEGKYEVSLIEQNQDLCNRLAEEVEAVILCGDGTDPAVLIDADIANADMVAAVTGKDEENLVICQIAKLKFGVKKTIARVNNPKNTPLFKRLGVDRTVCSTEVIANLIEWELEDHRLNIVQAIDTGGLILAEATLAETNFWIGHGIDQIRIPKEAKIVSLIREGVAVNPMDGAKINSGDKLLMLTNMQEKYKLEQAIFEVAKYGY